MSDTTDCVNAESRGGHHAPPWLWCNVRGLQPIPRVHCGPHCHAYKPPAMAALDEQTQEGDQMAAHAGVKWDAPANQTMLTDGTRPYLDDGTGNCAELWRWVDRQVDDGARWDKVARLVGCTGNTACASVDRRRVLAGMAPRRASSTVPRKPPDRRPVREPSPAPTSAEPDDKPEPISDPMSANDPAQVGNEQLECSATDFAQAARAFIMRAGMDEQFGIYLAGWLDRDNPA